MASSLSSTTARLLFSRGASRSLLSKCVARRGLAAAENLYSSNLSKWTSSCHYTQHNSPSFRMMSNKTDSQKPPVKEVEEEPANEEKKIPSEEEKEQPSEEKDDKPTREEELESQVKDLKDQLVRSFAEQENIRKIAKRDMQSARLFAITSFAKSLLDTSDNLTRALDSVPEDMDGKSEEEVKNVLKTLYEGIQMTEKGLMKAFEKNGLKRYGSVGDKFDPNKHDALFEYVDKDKTAGTIGTVMKKGFMLHERSVRAAEVGVVKKE